MVPKHVAIIMDGNRRWARKRGLPDSQGHHAGADTLEKIIEAAAELGIKTLTVYALSTENLEERAKREIEALFKLITTNLGKKLRKMKANNVRLDIIGREDGLPESIKKIIKELKTTYVENETIRVNIALNYGGKKEIIDAIKRLVEEGVDLTKIDEHHIDKHLYTAGQDKPDLVIRTGGRFRLSNFLLWQTDYSELYFTKKLWPDFEGTDLKKAVTWYESQTRNFGK